VTWKRIWLRVRNSRLSSVRLTPKDGLISPARRCSATIALPLPGLSPAAASIAEAIGAATEAAVVASVEDAAATAAAEVLADPDVAPAVAEDASKAAANRPPVNQLTYSPVPPSEAGLFYFSRF